MRLLHKLTIFTLFIWFSTQHSTPTNPHETFQDPFGSVFSPSHIGVLQIFSEEETLNTPQDLTININSLNSALLDTIAILKEMDNNEDDLILFAEGESNSILHKESSVDKQASEGFFNDNDVLEVTLPKERDIEYILNFVDQLEGDDNIDGEELLGQDNYFENFVSKMTELLDQFEQNEVLKVSETIEPIQNDENWSELEDKFHYELIKPIVLKAIREFEAEEYPVNEELDLVSNGLGGYEPFSWTTYDEGEANFDGEEVLKAEIDLINDNNEASGKTFGVKFGLLVLVIAVCVGLLVKGVRSMRKNENVEYEENTNYFEIRGI